MRHVATAFIITAGILGSGGAVWWSANSWEPRDFVNSEPNIIPDGTYDFTYVEAARSKTSTSPYMPGEDSKNMGDASGRINFGPDGCELNASHTATNIVDTATLSYMRSSAGPMYARLDASDQGNRFWDGDFHDWSLVDSPSNTSFFPPLLAASHADEFGSFCSLAALGTLTNPTDMPGTYDWNVGQLQQLAVSTSDHRANNQFVSLGLTEPKLSLANRPIAQNPYVYEYQFEDQVTAATDEAGVITIQKSNDQGFYFSAVLTPTDEPVDTATPPGAVPADTAVRQGVKEAGGVAEYMGQ